MKGTHVFEVYKNSVLGKQMHTNTLWQIAMKRKETKGGYLAQRVPHKTKTKIGHKRDNFYLSLI